MPFTQEKFWRSWGRRRTDQTRTVWLLFLLSVGLTHQSLYCNRYDPTTPLVFSAWECSLLFDTWGWLTWRVSYGGVRLRLGRRWTRHKKNDWRQTSRHDCFVDAISRRVTDVRPRYQTSVAAADTAAPKHIPHGRWAGRKETAADYGEPSWCEWSQQRWIMVQFSLFRTTAPPETFIQRRRPTRNSSQKLRNQSKNYASRSRAWRWANTAVLTETPSSSSILHFSYKPELSYSCLPKINLLFSLLLLEYSTWRW